MKTLVIAPHPDDETLGCAGTLLRRKSEGAELAWLIVTCIYGQDGITSDQTLSRDRKIADVAERLGIDHVYDLRLPTTRLDTLPFGELVGQFSTVFAAFRPEEVLVPHCSDAHSDHRLVFDAAAACTKWFRYPFVKRVLAYETLSETGFGLDPSGAFQPNYFLDISNFLEQKLDVMIIYKSELGDFPFPRSLEAIRALAALRGASSGFAAAEAFQLLRERN